MSVLIKQSRAREPGSKIAAFGIRAVAIPSESDAGEARLRARIAALEAASAEAEERHARDLERARAEGAEAALEERSDRDERALALLREAIGTATAGWEARLASWDGVATGLARAILSAVFADSDQCSGMVQACIARKLATLKTSAIVRIRVSPLDFTDADALDLLGRTIPEGLELAADPGLGSGECLIDLRLGHVDLSLDSQWREIAQFLDSLEQRGGQ